MTHNLQSYGTNSDRRGGAGRGSGILRAMVLAASRMARLPRGNGGSGALAMAGGDSIGAGICSCSTLHLGFRLDGAWHARAFRSASAVSGEGFLPLRAQPDVLGLRRRLDRAMGD